MLNPTPGAGQEESARSMSFVVRRGPPETETASPSPREKFPARRFFLAFLAAVGLFSWVVLVIPEGLGNDSTALTQIALDASRMAGSYPWVLALLLSACFVPSLCFPASAGKYLFRLALVLTLAWLGLFMVTVNPVARAAEKVRETLSIQRNFPNPITNNKGR